MAMWGQDPVFRSPDVQPAWSRLTEESQMTPRAAEVFKVIACTMGGALALAQLPEPQADAHVKISKFYQFCTSELKTPKKELPKPLVERLDKVAKDCCMLDID